MGDAESALTFEGPIDKLAISFVIKKDVDTFIKKENATDENDTEPIHYNQDF